jgi:hypothetical protein
VLLQASFVEQGLLSSQDVPALANAPLHSPEASHRSLVVQLLPSLQLVPVAFLM